MTQSKNSAINRTVLMSDARYFDNGSAINPYMSTSEVIDRSVAQQEHDLVGQSLEEMGVRVIRVSSPVNCQDGIYTANWALCRGNRAVLSSLPGVRSAETGYAAGLLAGMGKEVHFPPQGVRFSGQGDALPCGDLLFMGSTYRTDEAMSAFIAEKLGYEVIQLQTVPVLGNNGAPKINQASGWPDSLFYDIDLALAVISPDLIAWCPQAFTPESNKVLNSLPLNKIEVSLEEATEAFACNLVSTGSMVLMTSRAPRLQEDLMHKGIGVKTLDITELRKGGGYIRCTTLTVDND